MAENDKTLLPVIANKYISIKQAKQTVIFFSEVVKQDVNYTLHDLRHRKLGYCLGFTSIFLVVLVMCVTGTAITNTPIMFLRMAEETVGQYDVKIASFQTANSNSYYGLNFTALSPVLNAQAKYSYHSPRFLAAASTSSTMAFASCNPPQSIIDDANRDGYVWSWSQQCPFGLPRWNSTSYVEMESCLIEYCDYSFNDFNFFAIDTKAEKRMGFGRDWSFGVIPMGSALISNGLAKKLGGVSAGDTVIIALDLFSFYHNTIRVIANRTTIYGPSSFNYDDNWVARVRPKFHIPLKIHGIIPSSALIGKFTDKTILVVEYKYLQSLFTSNFPPGVPDDLLTQISNINPFDFASSIYVNFPPPRIDAYLQNSYQVIQSDVVKFASEVSYTIGFDVIDPQMPLLQAIAISEILKLFLGLILNIIVLVLVILSIMLIYALLMVSVETRIFETAILRTVGMTRLGVIFLICIQSWVFAIPAWAFGLITGRLVNQNIVDIFVGNAGYKVSSELESSAVGIATVLGLFIPLLAGIIPIRSALEQDLVTLLDVRRNKVQAVKYTIERASETKINTPLLLIGVLLSIFGVVIYYFIPLALLTFDLAMLLNVFLGILLGMLGGLVLLSTNIQMSLERLIAFIFLYFWEKPAIRTLLRANMIAHKERNRKTAMMYSLSLAFIIFVNVYYQTQILSFQYSQLQTNGCKLQVLASISPTNSIGETYYYYSNNNSNSNSSNNSNNDVNNTTPQSVVINKYVGVMRYNRIGSIPEFEQLLIKFRDERHVVKDWTYVSLEMHEALGEQGNFTSIENIGHIYSATQHVYGISPNYFNVAEPGFLIVNQQKHHSKKLFSSLSEVIYTPWGSSGLVLGTSYKQYLGAKNLEDDILFRLSSSYLTPYLVRLHTIANVDAAPGFKFSKFPSAAYEQDSILSFPSMLRFGRGSYKSFSELGMGRLMIKLHDGINKKVLNELIAELDAVIEADPLYAMSVWDYNSVVGPTNTASSILTTAFSFITFIVMVICFFSLVSSMVANIHEQTKEIGILRAIGIPKTWMTRVYVYEAFIVVFASGLLGTIVGTFIGFTITLQSQLFTQLPIAFSFPSFILFVIFILSFISAFASSYQPIHMLLHTRSTVELIKFIL